MDIRKFGITIAVAILTGFFIYTIADAVAPQPEYKDCYGPTRGYTPGLNEPMMKQVDINGNACVVPPIDRASQQACIDAEGQYQSVLDSNGCVAQYECSFCQKEYNALQGGRSLRIFIIALVLGLAVIILGFMLPLGSVHEWVGLGFILGGVFGMFYGTTIYWQDLGRWLRPLLILVELGVILFIVYRRIASNRDGEDAGPRTVVAAPAASSASRTSTRTRTTSRKAKR